MLVLSSSKLWKDYCGKIEAAVPENIFQVMTRINKDSWESPNTALDVFDSLIWVNPAYVVDVDIDTWYKMLEFYSETDLQLKRYIEEQPRDVQSNKFDFNQIDKSVPEFVEENTAPNTIKSNKTVIKLFDNFLSQMFPNEKLTIDSVSKEKLPELASKFFMSLQKDVGISYNASTLQIYYHAMCRVLLQKRDINLKLDPAFGNLSKVLSRKQRLSVLDGETPGKHRSLAIPATTLAKCWADGHFGSKDPRSLISAVILHIQATFGTRAKTELHSIRNSDILIGPEREDGIPSHLSLSERLTKTRHGLHGQGKYPFFKMQFVLLSCPFI